MKSALVQVKYRLGDFEYNFNKVMNNMIDADLVIFPSLSEYLFDENFVSAKMNFYKNLSKALQNKAVLIGNVFIRSGNVAEINNGFIEINNQKIYIADKFDESIDCDLYILAKNSYFALNALTDLTENIITKNNFVYINSIELIDENVYAGGSFAKNSKNEIVLKMSICEERMEIIDFSNSIDSVEDPIEADIEKVLKFALKEYCEITGFKKVLLGLSGGIDSALTAVLATEALGVENVLGIMLPSMYSSKGSIEDSLNLALNLGIKTEKIPITPMFNKFMEEFDKKSDLAEENLQARLRGLILMFLSNREGYLLLSTGNKSESAMGYGTLYGDMAGGINLLADLTKTNVYRLSNWINRDKEIIPRAIIEKVPSAELRPNQKDQDYLPEYNVLDNIIELFFEKSESLYNIYKKYDKSLVDDVIKRVYKAQFKRNQSCLGIRLTEKAFCSNLVFPITQRFY